jgi:hypothetical protein
MIRLVRVNYALTRAGARITTVVGTMWMALAFAAIALVSLPAAMHTGDVVVIVGWVAQTFLQLVLLSVIMVGQSIESARTETRDAETHDAVMAEHAETRQLVTEMAEVLKDLASLVTPSVEILHD